MSKTFVMGDIHGAYEALLQCLERSNFNYDEDTLIQLGDVVDGWGQSYECVEELIKIRYLVAIRGNHDQWFNELWKLGRHGSQWTQGAGMTARSYLRNLGWDEDLVYALDALHIPAIHKDFFDNQKNYHIIEKDGEKTLFVHGGYNRHDYIHKTVDYLLYWDRDMWSSALSFQSMIKGGVTGRIVKWKTKDNFKEIFIGHTTTGNWGTDLPMKAADTVYNLDTGAGFEGKLTIMDLETKSFWQSDKVSTLYPKEKGRR